MARHETKLFYANTNGIIYGHNIAIVYRRTSTVVYVHNITCATIHNKMIFDWKHRPGGARRRKKKHTHNLRSMDMTLHNPYTGTKETYAHDTELTCDFFETCAVWGRCWCNFIEEPYAQTFGKKTIASSKGLHGVDGFRAVWAHGCVSHLWAASDAQRLSVKFSLKNPFFLQRSLRIICHLFLQGLFKQPCPVCRKKK